MDSLRTPPSTLEWVSRGTSTHTTIRKFIVITILRMHLDDFSVSQPNASARPRENNALNDTYCQAEFSSENAYPLQKHRIRNISHTRCFLWLVCLHEKVVNRYFGVNLCACAGAEDGAHLSRAWACSAHRPFYRPALQCHSVSHVIYGLMHARTHASVNQAILVIDEPAKRASFSQKKI
jgi:hypothetical protein